MVRSPPKPTNTEIGLSFEALWAGFRNFIKFVHAGSSKSGRTEGNAYFNHVGLMRLNITWGPQGLKLYKQWKHPKEADA
jgi:hypothetical protein